MEELVMYLINALTVEERRTILGKVKSDNNNIEIWRSVNSRISEKNFEYRLLSQNYTHEEFNNCIQNVQEITDEIVLEKLRDIVRQSEWYKTLLKIEQYSEKNNNKIITDKPDISLTMFYFVEWAIGEVKNAVKEYDKITIDSNVISKIEINFYSELLNISSKTLVYEFNENKRNYNNRFTICDFINLRFGSFQNSLEFFKEYPVLLRRLAVKIDYIYQAVILMFQRINDNIDKIQNDINNIELKKITDIYLGVGDTHAKGKNVVILNFGEQKVVYKPHNCEFQKHYNEVLTWINREAELLPFYITKDYYSQDFAINEYIDYDDCMNELEIKRFYTRMGQHIAILYLLGATDIHCENIIAKSEYPVIIDHETLYYNNHFSHSKERDLFDELQEEINESVLNTGIFPMYVKGHDFGALAKRKSNDKINFWMFVNKDDESLCFEQKDMHLQDNKNLPKLDGNVVGFEEYRAEIIWGYEKTMEFLRNNIEKMEKMTPYISNLKVRIVLQATQKYSDLYQYISHPKYMCDMLSLDRLLENLWMEHGGSSQQFKYEVLDAHNCDIPIFYTVVGKKSLYSSNGEKIDNYFSCTGLDILKGRIKNLKQNTEKQLLLMKKQLGLLNEENTNWYLSASQRIRHTKNTDVYGMDEIRNVIYDINEYIGSRVKVEKNIMSWYEIRDDKDSLVASSNYIDGTTGLAVYLLDCKRKLGIHPEMEKLIVAATEMVVRKKKYTTYKQNSSYFGLVSNLNLILRCYKDTKKLVYQESIVNMAMFYEEIKKGNIDDISILELASHVEIFARTFIETKDFKIQNLIESCGTDLIKKISEQGLGSIKSSGMLNIGNVINAFGLLSKVSSMPEFSVYLDSLLCFVEKEKYWSEEGMCIRELRISTENGDLQRFAEKLIECYKCTKISNILDILKEIIECVLTKKDYENDTFCNGTVCVMNLLISYLEISEEDKIKDKIDDLMREILWGFKVNKKPRIYNGVSLPSISIDKGYVGFAHVLLRYLYRDVDTLLL